MSRIKDFSTTATGVAADDFFAIDGTTNGTRKISQTNALRDSNGAVSISAGGTNQSISLTPSGTGSVSFKSVLFVTNNGADGDLWGTNGGGLLRMNGSGAITLSASQTNQNITLTPSGTGFVQLGTTGNQQIRTGSGDFLLHAQGGRIRLTASSGVGEYPSINLFGTTVNSSNGAIQLNTHTTIAGGIGFGTDVALHRRDANTLNLVTTSGTSGLVVTTSAGERGQILASGSDLLIDNRTSIGSVIFRTNTSVTALTLDSSQDATFVGSAIVGATKRVGWNGRARVQSPSDGIVTLFNAGETDFSRLQFGGTTASFPAIKRNGTWADFVLANDTAFTGVRAAHFRASLAAVAVSANEVSYGGTTATTATAGTNGDVPAQVAGYIIVNVSGTTAKIPYYNN